MNKIVVISITILLMLSIVTSLGATEFRKGTWAVKTGYINPAESGTDESLMLGVEYSVKLLKGAVSLGLNWAQYEAGNNDGSWLNVPLTYKIGIPKSGITTTLLNPYVSIGLDWVRATNGKSENAFGGHLSLGLEKGPIFGEIGYLFAEKENTEYGGFNIVVGYKF